MDKIWSVHGSLQIPLTDVMEARVENENAWEHLWRKIIGTSAPGLEMDGTFFMDGGLVFLDYSTGRNCVVIETQHQRYRTIIVQPDGNASAVVAEINRRAKPAS